MSESALIAASHGERVSYRTRKNLSYLFFIGLFAGEVALAASLGHAMQMDALRWLMLAFAVFRFSRLVSYDGVFQPIRSPFCNVVPHDSRAGDTTCARTDAGAFREVVGELICCPICNGTHITTLLILGLALLPGVTNILVVILAIIGLREMLEPIFELVQWKSECARHECGPLMEVNRKERE